VPIEKLQVDRSVGAREGESVLRCVGPLIMETLFAFQNAIIKETAAALIIDMTEVPRIDSAGLASLVQAYVSSRSAGRRLALIGVNHRVRALLQMTKLERFFPIFESRGEAEQSVSQAQAAP